MHLLVRWLLVLGLITYGVIWRRRAKKSAQETEELRKELEVQRQGKDLYFNFLQELGEAFTENLHQEGLLQVILRCAIRVTDAKSGAVYLLSPEERTLSLAVMEGVFPPPVDIPEEMAERLATRQEYLEAHLKTQPIPLDSPACLARAIARGESELVRDATHDKRFPAFTEASWRVKTYLAMPLEYRGDKLGTLVLANKIGAALFSESDREIVKAVAQQAAFSFHSAQLYEQIAEKRKLDNDIKTARDIQRILLPQAPPLLNGFILGAQSSPAQKVSGDYYDFIRVNEDSLGIAVADVSGKGIAASLIMAMCRSVLRSVAPNTLSPAHVLRELNRRIYPDLSEDMFITMIYLVLNTRNGSVNIARAGHESPLLFKNGFREMELISPQGLALGIDGGNIFDEVIEDATLNLAPEDTLILYTDGLSEALNEQGKEFGRENLKDAILQSRSQGVEFMVGNVMERVRRFSGESPANDDITLVALQKTSL